MFNFGLNLWVKTKITTATMSISDLLRLKLSAQQISTLKFNFITKDHNDKVINFIRVKEFDTTLEIPSIFEYTGIGYLGGKTINQLINAEADSTRVALSDYSRPTITITLDQVDAYNVAQLLYMLEVQTAIAGELYNINTFNQPGVEQAKNYTYALMGRAGYEDSAKALQDKMATV